MESADQKVIKRARQLFGKDTILPKPIPEVEQMVAVHEAKLADMGNPSFRPDGSPTCYGSDLYDPTVEEIHEGRLMRPCVVCSLSRSCGEVVKIRYGFVPGDTMPPTFQEVEIKKDLPVAPPKPPKSPGPVPPSANRPRDPITGMLANTKTNTIFHVLLRGATKTQLVEEVMEEHGGEESSNRNTVSVALADLRKQKYNTESLPVDKWYATLETTGPERFMKLRFLKDVVKEETKEQ